jgi:replicative DNA helicase
MSARLPKERRLDRNWTMPDSEDEVFGHRQPASPDSERGLLGAALLDPTAVAEVGTLEPEDFYIAKHGDIWAAMLELSRKRESIDIITVREQLGDHPSVDSTTLADLLNGVPATNNATAYANRIRNAARRRKIIRAATEITMAAYQEADAGEAEEQAKQILLHTLDTPDSEQKILSPMAQAHLLTDMLEARAQGEEAAMSTGYESLDSLTSGGFRGGELITIAARTSVGKSSFAENIAENIAKRFKSVLYFNLEMSPKKMLERFAKRQHRLSLGAYIDGPTEEEDIRAMYEIAEMRSNMPLTLVNDGRATTASIWAITNQHIIRHGKIDLIVVDYLQLVNDKQSRSGSEVQRIGHMMVSLKALAREHDVPLVLISQLNRNVEHRGGEPELYDLRDSGSIEQDSDIVILMWIDEDGNVQAKIGKQRDGPRDVKLHLDFDGASFTFSNGAPPIPVDFHSQIND